MPRYLTKSVSTSKQKFVLILIYFKFCADDKVAELVSKKLLEDEAFVRQVCNVVVEQNRTRKARMQTSMTYFNYNFRVSCASHD